jgi:serine/threonine protein kinase
MTVLNKVGMGAFGEVYRARLWGTEIAVKTLKTEKFADPEKLLVELKKGNLLTPVFRCSMCSSLIMIEVQILSQLRHPNVVLYIGACTKPPNVCLMTEWCSRGR